MILISQLSELIDMTTKCNILSLVYNLIKNTVEAQKLSLINNKYMWTQFKSIIEMYIKSSGDEYNIRCIDLENLHSTELFNNGDIVELTMHVIKEILFISMNHSQVIYKDIEQNVKNWIDDICEIDIQQEIDPG